MPSIDYLAGFIDGEGSLSLVRRPRGESSPEYYVRISIANTNRAILQEIQKKWGGSLHGGGKSRKPKWKPGFVLIWTNAAAVTFLRQVASHLWLKSEHAEVLLEFAEHLKKCRRRRDEFGRLLPFQEEETKLREVYFRRLKHLNRRGVADSGDQSVGQVHSGTPRGAWIPAAYLAGFIDGEGSVMITRSCSHKSRGIQYRARLCVTNTDRGILEQIRKCYRGVVVSNRRGAPRWKEGYQLVWTDGLIADLLALIGPHLRLKRKQAEVQLEFIRHKKRTPRSFDGRFLASHPPEVIRFREALYQQMKGLNARGVASS